MILHSNCRRLRFLSTRLTFSVGFRDARSQSLHIPVVPVMPEGVVTLEEVKMEEHVLGEENGVNLWATRRLRRPRPFSWPPMRVVDSVLCRVDANAPDCNAPPFHLCW